MTVSKKICEYCGVLVSVRGRHINRKRCTATIRGASVGGYNLGK